MLGLLLLLGAGCGPDTTDTGYEPRRLGMTEAQRKALYAPQFSQEKAQAESAQQQGSGGAGGSGARRPGGVGVSPY
jgi:hypothetical protein